MRAPLGEILLEHGLITDVQLLHALMLQKHSGSRLGDILIANGMINYYDLYCGVAHHHGLPFIDLLKEPPAPELLQLKHADDYLRLNIIPWRQQNGQMTVAACDLSEEAIGWIKKHYGSDTLLAITSPFDIRRSIEKQFGVIFEKSSRLSLWENNPQASARVTVPPVQKKVLVALLTMTIAFIALYPIHTALMILGICQIAFAATMLFKALIFTAGIHKPTTAQEWERRLATLDERTLPVYTILIPMYREAESLPNMLDYMRGLDYPAARLDIKLVMEADDHDTLNAAYALKPRYQFDIIRIPPDSLRTKPKACNYALRFARGELLTIFDADDKPERTQLKKAVYMFRNLPDDVVCLQARLNYYNANDTLLTRFFSLEYTILFHFMLHGLERIGIPIPLGGTSNHMPVARLKELGEWDPYNVTEDADLGTRLAALGLKTAMLDSYTMEEAPEHMRPWIRQRSRWIKGYMQTWLVHMRAPLALYRTLGWKSFTGFQFFVGLASFTFLTAPLVWVISLLWITGVAQVNNIEFPNWLAWLATANLLLNLFTHWSFGMHCAQHYRKDRGPLMVAALLYPFYLILHSIASYKALWQLIFRPHFWEKTTHGAAKPSEFFASESDLLKMQVIRLPKRKLHYVRA